MKDEQLPVATSCNTARIPILIIFFCKPEWQIRVKLFLENSSWDRANIDRCLEGRFSLFIT